MIVLKIDVTLVNKAKLFPGTKRNADGKIPQYLDIVLFENRHGEDPYGNHYVACESLTKEERAAGKKGRILGNAKIIGGARPPQKPQIEQLRQQRELPVDTGGDDFPG